MLCERFYSEQVDGKLRNMNISYVRLHAHRLADLDSTLGPRTV